MTTLRARSGLVVLLHALLAAAETAHAQGVPLGPEFRVNSYITGHQYRSAVASDAAGNFIVMWESLNQDGSGFGIFAQRYDGGGNPLGGEFRVNTFTTGNQQRPAGAHDAAGNFVIVWQSPDPGGGGNVLGQRYAASTGAPLGGEFRVTSYTVGVQPQPAVASDPAGNFVVVWQAPKDGGPSYGVFGQRYASTGAPLGGQFQVNTYTTGLQQLPSVASDAAGNFVVAWVDSAQDETGIFAQRYASTGTPLGTEFRVNTFTTMNQFWPSVASDAAGNIVIVWYSWAQDGSSFGVFGQRYASTGTPVGGEFRVNSYVYHAQWFPAVASDAAGNFVVVWESYGDQDGHYEGIYAQRYAGAGSTLGGEFRVNSHTTHAQEQPSVASDSAGHFIVVWWSANQDGSGWGVFGQRYSMIVPVELQTFSVD